MKKTCRGNDYRDYKNWFPVKANIQNRGSVPSFAEGEIWWSAVGENVGIEINGKGQNFARPVAIFKKLSRVSFLGIPLTTKDHTDKAPDWYVKFRHNGKTEFAALAQIKIMSIYRLYRKMGTIDDSDIRKIHKGFKNLYLKNAPSQRKGCCGKIPNYFKLYLSRLKKSRKTHKKGI